jgi:glyoxylase-like metal-dependent hydrolase (beta-lactamase superfamily II)
VTEVTVTGLGGGVHRVTHPLPWALDHVHSYAIEDTDGWTIVDCGLGSAGTARRWAEALDRLGRPAVSRIVVTHYHPDHIGGSAVLAELAGPAEIVQGAYDAELARRVWTEQDGAAFAAYLALHGMPADEAARSAGDEGEIMVGLAAPSRLVGDGDTIELAGERFAVLVLPGHADGHIALYGERTGRLFGGDVLLDEITPNIGRWEDTRPDPLGRYLETLARLHELEPSVVLPGHRAPIERVRERIADVERHHAQRLDATLRALHTGAGSAYETALAIWGRELGFHEQRFALVEALAHLDRLAVEGRAEEVAPGRWCPRP